MSDGPRLPCGCFAFAIGKPLPLLIDHGNSLEYYDGAMTTVAYCRTCRTPYFISVLAWGQQARIFGLAKCREQTVRFYEQVRNGEIREIDDDDLAPIRALHTAELAFATGPFSEELIASTVLQPHRFFPHPLENIFLSDDEFTKRAQSFGIRIPS